MKEEIEKPLSDNDKIAKELGADLNKKMPLKFKLALLASPLALIGSIFSKRGNQDGR